MAHIDKKYILEFLANHKSEMQNRFGVVRIGLFGSYARDEATEKSDIDIAVEMNSERIFRSFFALEEFLEAGLEKKIDLGMEAALKPIVKSRVEKEIIYV
jgi:predicted nucleotidyltransferase